VTALSNFFVGIHRPKPLMVYALVAMVLNIPFNYVLINGAGPIPELGLAGAAYGTVVASFVQMVCLMCVFMSRTVKKHYRSGVRAPNLSAMWDLVKIGTPAALHMGVDILSWGVALVWMVGFSGTLHLAATTILVRVIHVSFMPAIGLAAILTALVGRAIGAGSPALAVRYTTLAARLAISYMGGFALLFFVLREPIMRFFTSNPEVIEIGAKVMVYVAAFQIFDAVNIIYTHALRGAGDTLWPSVVNFTLCAVVFIGFGYFLCVEMPELGSQAPWMAGALYITLSGVVFFWRWKCGPWSKMDIFSK
jgi:MATE family multidrug resistance protein